MTTFEIIVAVAIIAIVVLLVWLIHRINKVNDRYAEQFGIMCEILSGIRTDTVDIHSDTVDIFQKLNDIEDDILDDLWGIRLADKLGKTSPNVPISQPCYAPDNIRKWDCINCPKRSICGTWSTNISIKAEDAPLQEFFNDNKED